MTKMLLKITGPYDGRNSYLNVIGVANSLAEKLGLSPEDKLSLATIVKELAYNHHLYNPSEFRNDPVVEVSYNSANPKSLKIFSSGVIDEAQWQNLVAKLQYIEGKDPKQVLQTARKIISGDLPADTAGPTNASKGKGTGMLFIAGRAGGLVRIDKGEALGDVLHRFRLHVTFNLEAALRPDLVSSLRPVTCKPD